MNGNVVVFQNICILKKIGIFYWRSPTSSWACSCWRPLLGDERDVDSSDALSDQVSGLDINVVGSL